MFSNTSPIPFPSLTPDKSDCLEEASIRCSDDDRSPVWTFGNSSSEDSGLGMDDAKLSSPISWLVTKKTPQLSEFQIRRPSRSGLGRFHSFDVRRSLFNTKRPADDEDASDATLTKRLKLEPVTSTPSKASTQVEFAGAKSAVGRLEQEQDLTGDGFRQHCLPIVTGKHPDLKSVTPDTVAQLLSGGFRDDVDSFTILDCRYPYEYEGGHIKGAINIDTREGIQEFLTNAGSICHDDKRDILILHCEFSSERGPKLSRFLRSQDRELNKENYPALRFPEIYVLDGGYKAFFETHKSLCVPMEYVPMLHKNHTKDLRQFRIRSKSWNAGVKRRQALQSLRF